MNQPVQGCPSSSLCSSSRTLPPFSYRSQQHPTISFLDALFLLFAIPFRQHFPRICVLRHPTNVVRTPRSLGFHAGFYCWASENPLYLYICSLPTSAIFHLYSARNFLEHPSLPYFQVWSPSVLFCTNTSLQL